VQQSVAQLSAAQSAFAAQVRSTAEATEAKVSALQQSLTEGLVKLHAADEVQNKAAEAARASAASSAAPAQGQADVLKRLDSLERELRELKTLLSGFVADQTKANAAAAAAAKTASSEVLAALSNVTAAASAGWSFNHTQILESAKVHGLAASVALRRLIDRALLAAQEHYPTLQKQAQEFSAQGLEHASVLSVHANKATLQMHALLSKMLEQQGAPREYVSAIVWSAFGVAALLVAVILLVLIKGCCRCLCCCRSRRSTGAAAATNEQRRKKKRGASAQVDASATHEE